MQSLIKEHSNINQFTNFNKRFDLDCVPLGEGAFGKVFKATDLKNQDEKVAVKEVMVDFKNRMIAEIQIEECDISQFLTVYQHPNIMRFIDVVQHISDIKIAMQLVKGIDLN